MVGFKAVITTTPLYFLFLFPWTGFLSIPSISTLQIKSEIYIYILRITIHAPDKLDYGPWKPMTWEMFLVFIVSQDFFLWLNIEHMFKGCV